MADGARQRALAGSSVLETPGLVIDLRGPGVSVIANGRYWQVAPGTSVTLGRAEHCDIVFADPSVSRVHARLTVDPEGAASMTDLDSTNGTHRDGDRLPAAVPVALQPGAELTLGLSEDATVIVGESAAAVLDVDQVCLTATGTREVTIGRAPDNDLQLHDPEVSRRHARARPCEGGFEVTDIGSSNGTYVNGQPVQHAFLGPRDLLSVGRSTFRVINGHLVHSASAGIEVQVRQLGVQLSGGRELLRDVSFDVPAGQLVAVVGPSGAGKTTLLRALTGTLPASAGSVRCDGRDLYEEYPALRSRIGVVPQDDIVHPELSVSQALRYAAEIRLATDLDAIARRDRVETVMAQLKLSEHQDTTVSKLSGGQRKRVSVAMELLTEPGLLILDEPTSGLDPGLDRSVMGLLRSLADAGRTVVVITHNVANLHLCDGVLLLAPGGTVAYAGGPEGLLPFFEVPDYADVFTAVAEDPAAATERFERTRQELTDDEPGGPSPALRAPRRTRCLRRCVRQLSTLLRRQFRVVAADPSYGIATLALPAALALMAMAIPGGDGFARAPDPPGGEASQLLVIVMVGATFMGAAASIRELVRERTIFVRERAAGLSSAAYLVSKVAFVWLLTFVQALVLVGLVLTLKPRPDQPVLIAVGSAGQVGAGVELFLATAATAFASAVTGLLISSVVRTSEQVMPALVVLVMGQLVLCGGLITITDRAPLEQLSWLTPARWGYAAAAATVDLPSLNINAPADDLWSHTASAWIVAMCALSSIAVVCALATWLRLRRDAAG